jgi:hypothetical protein
LNNNNPATPPPGGGNFKTLGKPCVVKTEVISGTYWETYLRTLRTLRNPLGTHWEQGKKNKKSLSPLPPNFLFFLPLIFFEGVTHYNILNF